MRWPLRVLPGLGVATALLVLYALLSTARTRPEQCTSRPATLDEMYSWAAVPEVVDDRFAVNGAAFRRVKNYRVEKWWRDFATGEWEPETFRVFDALVTPATTVVDFGAWVGPTVLFAATRAKRVIAFECDPLAYFELQQNVRVNPMFALKTTLSQLCISDKVETLTMSGIGKSGSAVARLKQQFDANMKASANYTFTVDCLPLPTALMMAGDVTLGNGHMFIKIDTEGAESFIVPSLLEWLRGVATDKLPTIYLSAHFGFSKLTVESDEMKAWTSLCALYSHVLIVDSIAKGTGVPRAGNTFTASEIVDCAFCATVLHTSPFPPQLLQPTTKTAKR